MGTKPSSAVAEAPGCGARSGNLGRPSRAGVAPIALVVLLCGSTACSRVRQKPRLEPPSPPSMAGNVGVWFLESPSSSLPRDRNRRLYAPHPVSVPPPPYPEELLPKRRPPVTVTLRIVLETDGTVGEIFDSPLASAPLAAEDAPFRDAAVEAVRSWKFIPARVEILRDGTDLEGDGNPDYQIRVSLNAVRYYLDVAITFEIVEGKGKVQTGLAPGGQGARR